MRVSEGLLTLYTFDEGGGNTVYDLSGVGTALDLTIANPGNTIWGDGILTLDASTLISSEGVATKLNDGITATEEITIEAWLLTDDTNQNGPARIVTLSDDPLNRNFTLGQQGNDFNVRLRTTTTGNNGSNQSLSSPGSLVTSDLTHVVYTREADGDVFLYVDNQLVSSGNFGGNLSNWNLGYEFALGNELNGDRPWLGTFDLVAVYNQAFDAGEVEQNFLAGADGSPSPLPPVAEDDNFFVIENSSNNILDVLTNDSDPNDDPLSLSVLVNPGSGTATVDENGTPGDVTDDFIRYTPNLGFTGTDTFTYQVDDGTGEIDTGTVTITVTEFNNVPTAEDDNGTTDEEIPVDITVLANDSDLDGDDLSLTLVNTPTNGIATVEDNGTPNNLTDDFLRYTPNTNFTGTDTFTYQVDDGKGGIDTATVTVTVNNINDAPIANDETETTDVDTAVDINVLGNDSDIDGDDLTLTLLNAPINGTATVEDNGTPNNLTDDFIRYTPNTNFTGTDTFTYQVDDGNGETDSATVTISVSEPNLRVTEGLLTLYTFDEGSGNTVYDLSGVGTALDLTIANPGNVTWGEGQLTLEASTLISSGSVATKLNDGITATEEITIEAWLFTDNINQSGPARMVTLSDDPLNRNFTLGQQGNDFNARLRTTTTGNNGSNQSLSSPGSLVTSDLTHVVYTREADGDVFLYVDNQLVSSGNFGGNLSNWNLGYDFALGNELNGDRPWLGTFDLVAVYNQAFDAGEVEQNFLVGPEGIPPNFPPNAIADTATTDEDTPVEINVLANDSDAEGDPLTLTVLSNSNNGSAIVDNNGTPGNPNDDTLLYTPNPNFNGTDTFTYNLFDGINNVEGTVTITVNPTPDTPIAIDDTLNTGNENLLSGNVFSNNGGGEDSDPDGDSLTVIAVNGNGVDVGNTISVISTGGRNGSVTLNADGTFTFNPQSNFSDLTTGESDTVSFQYTLSDGNGGEDTATVTLNVLPAQAPIAVDDTFLGLEEQTIVGNVLANNGNGTDSDPNGDPLTVTSGTITTTQGITLNLSANGDFVYTPNPEFSGTDSFTYTLSDGLLTDNATVTLTLAPVNDAPQILTGGSIFTKQVIATNVTLTHMIVPGDLDGDGDQDLVATAQGADFVSWYENDGSGNFTEYILDGNLAEAYPAFIADVDGDGVLDVLAAGIEPAVLAWYKNDGTGNFTKFVIDTTEIIPHSFDTADLDEDGDIDLVVSNQDSNNVVWYENDGNENFTKYTIDPNAETAKSSIFVDIDNDGDLDVAGISFGDDRVNWYENDGNQNFTRNIIDSQSDGGYFIMDADLDNDGDADLVTASKDDNTIAWYTNDGSGNFTKQIIDTTATAARAVFVVDIDNDGNLDVLSASVDNDTVALYLHDGNGNFTKQVIDDDADGAYGVSATDVDGDGLLDILSASKDDNTVSWYRHSKENEASLGVGSTLTIDTTLLQASDPDNSPSELTYALTDIPDVGNLQLNGVSLTVNDTFTQADIDNNQLTYVHTGVDTGFDNFAFTLTDSGNTVNSLNGTFTLTIDNSSPSFPGIRLNIGGDAYTDVFGRQWLADTYNLNGLTFEAGLDPNADTSETELYGTERFDTALAYEIPVDNGIYDINLSWLENVHIPGERLIDVLVEGQLILDNLDAVAEAGLNRLLTKGLEDISVTDGNLNLEFILDAQSVDSNAYVLAIEVLPGDDGNPGITVTGDNTNNTLSGSGNNDILIGVDTGDTTPGTGEIDIFTGLGGQDIFVLGDGTQPYYDDGNVNGDGSGDYGLITDFEITEGDVIQLFGSSADYVLGSSPAGLPSGQGIFRQDELIGIVEGVDGLTLNSPAFSFV